VRRTRPPRLVALALSAFGFAAGMIATPSVASADRVRIRAGGGVHVRAHGRVRVRGPRFHGRVYRPHYRPYHRRYFRPHIRLRYYPRPYFYPHYYYWGYGYRYATPPCHYECGPSYPPPATVAAPAHAPEPPMTRLGLGIFGGSVGVEDNDAGADVGLVGRVRLTRHFLIEAEVSKTELADGERVDKRIGGALLLDLAPRSVLSPYLLGGGGFGQTDVNDGTLTAEQAYGELGVGLEWRLGRHFALFGDLRAGVRESNASEEELLLVTGTGDSGLRVDDDEHFTRARLGAMLYF
jgi:hypothetical protein